MPKVGLAVWRRGMEKEQLFTTIAGRTTNPVQQQKERG